MGQANSIMVAGHDTTSFMLASTLYYLARWVWSFVCVYVSARVRGRVKRAELGGEALPPDAMCAASALGRLLMPQSVSAQTLVSNTR